LPDLFLPLAFGIGMTNTEIVYGYAKGGSTGVVPA